MRILVTGAAGFIGSAFTHAAIAAGHQVAGLIRRPNRGSPHIPSELSTLHGTLADPPWEEVERFAPEVCLHAAWVTTPGIYLDSSVNDELLQTSAFFIEQLFQRGLEHVVALGTCAEYQPRETPLHEETSLVAPATAYAQAKHKLQMRLDDIAARYGGSVCWTRVFYPYGPGEHPMRLCSSLIAKMAANQAVTLNHPDSVKDYIYIEDVASALLLLCGEKRTHMINIGTGEGTSVREIAVTIADILGKPQEIFAAPETSPDPLGTLIADPGKVTSLGWQPGVSLKTGLQRLAESLITAQPSLIA